MGRKESEDIFLKTLEDMLLNNNKLGINSLADKAGLNKVLIYRYFGGWDGLLETYAKKINLWQYICDELIEGINSGKWQEGKSAVLWVLKSYRIKLLSSPVYMRILKDELHDPSPLTKKLETEREEQGLRIAKTISQSFPEFKDTNTAYFASFVMGGITYLALKSTQVKWFTGIDLSLEDSWEEFDKVWLNNFLSV